MDYPDIDFSKKTEIHNVIEQNVDLSKPLDPKLIKYPEHIKYFLLISQDDAIENGIYGFENDYLVRFKAED
jgi:hypothetical protein